MNSIKNLRNQRPVFVIAEAGVNHNGSLARALKLVDCAADCGADAVKFQYFHTASLLSNQAPRATYQGQGDQASLLKSLELQEKDFLTLAQRCRQQKIEFMVSVFDEEALTKALKCKPKRIKLGSGEVDHLPLIKAVAQSDLPLIASLGMADLKEAKQLQKTFRQAGGRDLSLLHCVSLYPCPSEEMGLSEIQTLIQQFPKAQIGFSDHSLSLHSGAMAVALGARVIEKHLTLSRKAKGVDHQASLEPGEFKTYVQACREARVMVQSRPRGRAWQQIKKVARRSLCLKHDLPAGHKIKIKDLDYRRPGTGLSWTQRQMVVGGILKKSKAAGTIIKKQDVSK